MKKISLMYHDVFNDSFTESGFQNKSALKYKISRQAFENQISIISLYCESHLINKNNICLTFDDGGISFLRVIAPILEKFGFKGYFFIATKLINTTGFLSELNIVELDLRGHIIGTHSHSHPQNISVLSDGEIEYEWAKSITILAKILQKPIAFASIPNGFFSYCSRKVLFANGIDTIFTSNPTSSVKVIDNKMILGRFPVSSGMTPKDVVLLIKQFSILRIEQKIKWHLLKILKLTLGKYYFNLRNNLIRSK